MKAAAGVTDLWPSLDEDFSGLCTNDGGSSPSFRVLTRLVAARRVRDPTPTATIKTPQVTNF